MISAESESPKRVDSSKLYCDRQLIENFHFGSIIKVIDKDHLALGFNPNPCKFQSNGQGGTGGVSGFRLLSPAPPDYCTN